MKEKQFSFTCGRNSFQEINAHQLGYNYLSFWTDFVTNVAKLCHEMKLRDQTSLNNNKQKKLNKSNKVNKGSLTRLIFCNVAHWSTERAKFVKLLFHAIFWNQSSLISFFGKTNFTTHCSIFYSRWISWMFCSHGYLKQECGNWNILKQLVQFTGCEMILKTITHFIKLSIDKKMHFQKISDLLILICFWFNLSGKTHPKHN